jgi:hypothetical protein
MIIQALELSIYRQTEWGDCSCDGISNRYKTIIVPCKGGHITVDTDNPPDNYCKLEIMNWAGGEYKRFVPYRLLKNTMRQMGGTFAYSCDSRFHRQYGDYPIPIHDRVEKEW